jgi:nitrite reductase/ring-hydroxylating ferredoxin subunit
MSEIYLCKLSELKKDKFNKTWFNILKDEVGAIYENNKVYVYSTVCPHFGGEFEYNEKKNA